MATVTRERELLRELVALVRGECPSLLNEDSGGDVRLSMAIDDALASPPASDQPGPTVINEDDGDVTIDFDYAKDRVVSIRLGEESSGLSAFVDGESHALCPLDRVPPKVLALLRTEAKAVTLRQSDPPGLVASLREQVRRWRDRASGIDDDNRYHFNSERHARANQMDECADEIEELLPASPQAETKGDE